MWFFTITKASWEHFYLHRVQDHVSSSPARENGRLWLEGGGDEIFFTSSEKGKNNNHPGQQTHIEKQSFQQGITRDLKSCGLAGQDSIRTRVHTHFTPFNTKSQSYFVKNLEISPYFPKKKKKSFLQRFTTRLQQMLQNRPSNSLLCVIKCPSQQHSPWRDTVPERSSHRSSSPGRWQPHSSRSGWRWGRRLWASQLGSVRKNSRFTN